MYGFGLFVFVKFVCVGLSVGVSKVIDWDWFDVVFDVVFVEDYCVLVEVVILGCEVECGVLQGCDGVFLWVSLVGEIVVSGCDFYDFDVKYLDVFGVELVCLVDLYEQEFVELQCIVVCFFEVIGGVGFV